MVRLIRIRPIKCRLSTIIHDFFAFKRIMNVRAVGRHSIRHILICMCYTFVKCIDYLPPTVDYELMVYNIVMK